MNLSSYAAQLAQRQAQGNLRKLHLPLQPIDFFSNDYLGLARNQALAEQIAQRYENQGFMGNGATGSRLLSGNNHLAQQTEQQLANFFGGEAALLFNSGFVANSALLATVTTKHDIILCDSLLHASLHEGCRLSLARSWAFRHNDLDDFQKKLRLAAEKTANPNGKIFVVVESIYSMDGDQCLLQTLMACCKPYSNTYFIIDEAHSTGWVGQGRGLACAENVEKNCFARVYTFGKAMGVQGACVVGSQVLIEYLVNFAKGFIYTTAMPPHQLTSLTCALDYLLAHPHLISELEQRIEDYCRFFAPLQNQLACSLNHSPIQVVKIKGNEACKQKAADLQTQGFEVRAILSPTVAAGEERIRICLHTYNTTEEIEKLVKQINRT